MKFLLPFCVLIPLACTAEVRPPPTKTYVTKLSLENGKESILECDTGVWKGRITIAPDVFVEARTDTVTTGSSTESKTKLTLDGVVMTVERDGLLFGTDARVKLGDNAAVEIRKDGVYIAGAKALALPVK